MSPESTFLRFRASQVKRDWRSGDEEDHCSILRSLFDELILFGRMSLLTAWLFLNVEHCMYVDWNVQCWIHLFRTQNGNWTCRSKLNTTWGTVIIYLLGAWKIVFWRGSLETDFVVTKHLERLAVGMSADVKHRVLSGKTEFYLL